MSIRFTTLPSHPAVGLLTAALALSTPQSGDQGPIVRTELGELLDDWLGRLETFGMHGAILVEMDGEVVLAKGYGVADHATGRPLTRGTSFHLGSLGKQFTAACILKLESMGRLAVEDPVERYLDGVPDDKRGITIHQLLTHTSGLPYMPGDGSPLDLPLEFEPGERWAYSNPGYSVLARIVERVGGAPLADLAATLLFEPAGMSHTTYVGDPNWPTEDVARSYQDGQDLGPVSEDEPDPRFLGAGDVASCIDDLIAWEHALEKKTVLSAESQRKMFSEHVRNPGAGFGYGYAWMTTTTERGTHLVYHQGNYGGFNSDYRRYVDEGVTIIFLSNHYVAGRAMRDAVVNNVSRLIHGDSVGVPDPPRPTAPSDKTRHDEVRFPGPSGSRIEARLEGDGCWLRGYGQEAVRLVFGPQADDEASGFAEQANSTSVEVLLAASKGNGAPLRAHLSRSVMPDEIWAGLGAQLTEWKASLGELKEAAALGTSSSGGRRTGRTTVRLVFERGDRLVELDWGAGGGIYQAAPVEAPPARRFVFCEPGLVAFDIFTGQTLRISLNEKPGGWSLDIGGLSLESE